MKPCKSVNACFVCSMFGSSWFAHAEHSSRQAPSNSSRRSFSASPAVIYRTQPVDAPKKRSSSSSAAATNAKIVATPGRDHSPSCARQISAMVGWAAANVASTIAPTRTVRPNFRRHFFPRIYHPAVVSIFLETVSWSVSSERSRCPSAQSCRLRRRAEIPRNGRLGG